MINTVHEFAAAIERFVLAADFLVNTLATEPQHSPEAKAKHAADVERGYVEYHAARAAIAGDEVDSAGNTDAHIPMD